MSTRSARLPHLSQDRVGAADDQGASILHVDMDAFYASVSLLDRPELRGRPVIIGGGQRGVVLSATYEARQSGVHAAMPMGRARRLCPEAVVVHPDHERYEEVSAAVMAMFAEVTPVVEPLSMDEAFLDVAGARRRLGSPTDIAVGLRDSIADELGITASVGIGPNKLVAKVASGVAKPDGLLVVSPREAVSFLHRLPVGVIWGVGERTMEELGRLGLTTVSQVAHVQVETLQRVFGPAQGQHLHDLAWGVDHRRVERRAIERSIGNGGTFGSDVDDPEVIRRALLTHAASVCRRARAAGHLGRTVTITVRFADFTTITRSLTLDRPTSTTPEVYAAATRLFAGLHLQRARIRKVGVRLSGITDAATTPVQGLLDEPEHGWRQAEEAVDRAQLRFGAQAVCPAALLSA